jgi:FkbM family methyltransferase
MNVLRFAKRLPVHWNRERDYQERSRLGLGHDTICYDANIRFRCPNDALILALFQGFVFEERPRREARDFIGFSQGCTAFLDAGASAGIMSILFAVSRQKGSILSVEPEPRSLRLLEESRSLNAKPGIGWTIAPYVVSDRDGEATIDVSGLGATVSGVQDAAGFAQRRVSSRSLPSLCLEFSFRPDIIKLDVESYEHEAIAGSRELLGDLKPRIHLEHHAEMLRKRGCDPLQSLRTLYDLGYADLRMGRDFPAWVRAASSPLPGGHLPTTNFLLFQPGK